MNPSLLLLQGVGCQGWLLNEERKQHHHYDARAEQKHLLQGVPRIVFLQEVRQHVHQGDVEKATRGEGQDPGYCLLCSRRRSLDWRVLRSCVLHPHPQGGLGQNPAWIPGSGQLRLWLGPLF